MKYTEHERKDKLMLSRKEKSEEYETRNIPFDDILQSLYTLNKNLLFSSSIGHFP